MVSRPILFRLVLSFIDLLQLLGPPHLQGEPYSIGRGVTVGVYDAAQVRRAIQHGADGLRNAVSRRLVQESLTELVCLAHVLGGGRCEEIEQGRRATAPARSAQSPGQGVGRLGRAPWESPARLDGVMRGWERPAGVGRGEHKGNAGREADPAEAELRGTGELDGVGRMLEGVLTLVKKLSDWSRATMAASTSSAEKAAQSRDCQVC